MTLQTLTEVTMREVEGRPARAEKTPAPPQGADADSVLQRVALLCCVDALDAQDRMLKSAFLWQSLLSVLRKRGNYKLATVPALISLWKDSVDGASPANQVDMLQQKLPPPPELVLLVRDTLRLPDTWIDELPGALDAHMASKALERATRKVSSAQRAVIDAFASGDKHVLQQATRAKMDAEQYLRTVKAAKAKPPTPRDVEALWDDNLRTALEEANAKKIHINDLKVRDGKSGRWLAQQRHQSQKEGYPERRRKALLDAGVVLRLV